MDYQNTPKLYYFTYSTCHNIVNSLQRPIPAISLPFSHTHSNHGGFAAVLSGRGLRAGYPLYLESLLPGRYRLPFSPASSATLLLRPALDILLKIAYMYRLYIPSCPLYFSFSLIIFIVIILFVFVFPPTRT